MWSGTLAILVGCMVRAHATVLPTNQSIFVYDAVGETTFGGAPVSVGAVIDAYDPDGVHCGTYTLWAGGPGDGFFQAIAVYKDDPQTPGIDEGASYGDEIAFRINGYPALVTRNGPVIWDGNGSTHDISLRALDIALEFSTQPSGSISGLPLATPPVVRALNDGSVDGSVADVFTLTLASGAGTLSGTLTATANAGVATFSNVIYTAAVDGESFSVRVDDQTGVGVDFPVATSATLPSDVLATHLAFITQPAGSVSGSALITQPVLAALDAGGQTDTDFSSTVTPTTASTGTLTGTARPAISGVVASFDDIEYSATADWEPFTIQMIGGGLTGTSASVASDVVATQLVFTTQPAGSVSGAALTTQPVVAAVDGALIIDTDFVALVTPTTVSAGALTGTARPAVGGVVGTFDDLVYAATTDQESFTIQVSGGGLSGSSAAISSDIAATQLVFSAQPSGSVSGIALTMQPAIAAVDGDFSVDTDFISPVTLTSSGAGSLAATPVSAVAGAAVFTDVTYTAAADGEAFTLQADAGGLVVTSAPVVSDVVATHLAFTTQPGRAFNGGPMLTQPVVAAQGPGSATDTDFTETVTLTATANTGGGTLSGDVAVAAVAGVAAYQTVQYDVDSEGDRFTLTANDQDGAGSDLPTASSISLVGARTGYAVPLKAGYNLISLGGASGNDPIAFLTQSLGTNLVRVLGFESPIINPNPPVTGAKLYDPSLPAFANTLQWTDPRLGYWLKVSEDDTLVIGGAMGKVVASLSPTGAELPCHADGRLHPVRDFMGIHGNLSLKGQPAPWGTVVEVVDTDGNLAGMVEVHRPGYYGFLPIYRDNPGSAVDEGADTGEWLTLRVNGLSTGEVVQWTEFGDVMQLNIWMDDGGRVPPQKLPSTFALRQNYPNPFNPATTISYQLPSEQLVSLSIHDLGGQMVRHLVREVRGPGTYSVLWDGRDEDLLPVSSGCYLYRLQTGGFRQTRKLLLLK